VDPQGLLDPPGSQIIEIFGGLALIRRVIDQDIDAAEALDGLPDDLFAGGGLREIGGDRETIDARFADDLFRLEGVGFLFWEIGKSDARSFASESQRHSAADAAIGAGDESNPALESTIPPV